MADGQEGGGRWTLRYVIVPIVVVVAGAGATYYFNHRDDGAQAAGIDTPSANPSGSDEMAATPATGATTGQRMVPPPPKMSFGSDSGGVVVQPPPSMGSRSSSGGVVVPPPAARPAQ